MEGVSAVHPTSFSGTFKHPKETNATWKTSGECELYAPETKCYRRAAIPAHSDGTRSVRAVRILLFILYLMEYDACSMYVHCHQHASGVGSATAFRRRFYSVDIITRMAAFLCWAFCQSTFGSRA